MAQPLLIDSLTYIENQAASNLTSEECDLIASYAKLNGISYRGLKEPGVKLLNDLNRRGYSARQYRKYLSAVIQKAKASYYRPQTKVAILIGNNNYVSLTKLAAPTTDCDSLAETLKSLGFVTVIIKNITTDKLRSLLEKVFDTIPKDSYCFIYYAGHGFECHNIKYIVCVDSPKMGVRLDHCVTENGILKYVSKCKPELCVLIMDMCRMSMTRETDPQLYEQIPQVEAYKLDRPFFIIYTTQSGMSAFERVDIEYSRDISNNCCDLTPSKYNAVVGSTSQYVQALCSHLKDNVHVSAMLDRVHEDLDAHSQEQIPMNIQNGVTERSMCDQTTDSENELRKQIPIKIQSGVAKRSLHDQTVGDVTEILISLRKIAEEFKEYCSCD